MDRKTNKRAIQQITLNNDMTQSTFNEDSGEGKGKKRKSSKADIIKRMLRSYKERNRKEKIAKLMSSNDHWKGLS